MCREGLEFELSEYEFRDVVGRLRDPDWMEVLNVYASVSDLRRAVFGCDFIVAWRAPNGVLGAIGGATGDRSQGVIWALTTELVERYPSAFHRASRCFVGYIKPAYDRLLNFVPSSNTVTIEWLLRLGFTVHDMPTPYGVTGEDHYLFDWRTAG